jgi:hypothetical protein
VCGIEDYLRYDKDSGLFYWIKNTYKRNNIGEIAGSLERNGYIRISVLGNRFLAHRLAWYFIYGVMPTKSIDHINGIRTDNRIDNLREVSSQENSHNSFKKNSNNSTGYLGVSYFKTHNKFHAQIEVDKKTIHLGFYNSPEEAHKEYLKAKLIFHPSSAIAFGGV